MLSTSRIVTIAPGSLVSAGARIWVCAVVGFSLIGALGITPELRAQVAPTRDHAQLDAFVELALTVSPVLRAAGARVQAARARVTPAGTLPDPMLGVGIINLPTSEAPAEAHASTSPREPMTMKMLSVSQTLPYRGKLRLLRAAAEHEVVAAEAHELAAQLAVVADVRTAYYDLAFYQHAAEVLENTQKVLVNFIEVTESRYAVGSGGQQDILRARVEAARIADDAVSIAEQRRAALARLNAVLDRASDEPVHNPRVPERIARAAVADDPARIRFTSAALGSRAAESPLPPLQQLQERAIASNPLLRAYEAEIAAQTARVELASKAHLPDFDLSLQYGQRNDLPDMLSFMVSVPVPLHRSRRQDPQLVEARTQLDALRAEQHAMANRLRADVAEAYSAAERARAQLALFVKAIIPQGRGALESARSAFQVGRADFLTLLDNQNTLFNYELEYFRTLSDFAKQLAHLERLVGAEVLP